MPTAITSAAPALPALQRSFSSGQAVITASDGSVAADLKVISTSQDGQLAVCELRIANETASPLSYQLAIVQNQQSLPLSLAPLVLTAASALATTINVRRMPGNAPQRLVAELHGPATALTVEAPLPFSHSRYRQPWAFVAMLFAIAALLEAVAFAYRPVHTVRHVSVKTRKNVRIIHPARIISLSLDSQRVPAGGIVTAHYEAIGDWGSVQLVDTTGTTWSQVPLRSNGLARLSAPDVPRDQEMRVVLTVNHAGNTATSNAGVIVVANTPHAALSPSRGALHDPEGIMAVSRNRFPGGSTINVRILRYEDHLRVALRHADGSEVSAVQVVKGERAITLVAPETSTADQYTILASYVNGISEQISVIPITLYPR